MGTRKYILASFLLFIGLNSFAQSNNYKYVDSTTLTLFYRQSWDSLITIGEKAIDNNLDYFYLRYRIGQAYLAKGKPMKAIAHFEKAKKFNGDDIYNLDALYYSYIMSNKQLEARLLKSKFPPSLENKYDTPEPSFSEIYFETGYTFSNNFKLNADIPNLGPGIIYTEHDKSGGAGYGHLGVKKNIGNRSEIYVGLSTLSLNKIVTFQAPNLQNLNPKAVVYNSQQWSSKKDEEYRLKQKSLYISYSLLLNKKTKITASGQLINVNSDNIIAIPYQFYLSTSKQSIPTFYIKTTDTSFYNYSLALNFSRRMKNMDINIFATSSGLNGYKQMQAGLGLYYYPFGNFNLYGYSGITGFKQQNNKRLVIDQMIGIKVAKKIWSEFSYTYGNLTNYTDKNAFVVLNISDEAKNRFGVNLIYSVNSLIDLSVNYQLINRESKSSTYDNTLYKTYQNYKYTNQSIIGGIKWKF